VLSRPEIRRILRDKFPTDVEFEAFCMDHFAEIAARFSDGMDRLRKENFF
jgi:hypothetical protein